MKYNQLVVDSKKPKQRVGRGISAGRGKTAGRGTKGQNSRAGNSRRPGFEGGQNPLAQRLPKLRGFISHSVPTETVSTTDLVKISSGTIDSAALAKVGLISSPYIKVKLLYGEKVEKKYDVRLQAASQSAVESIQKAGGSFKKTPRTGRTSSKEVK